MSNGANGVHLQLREALENYIKSQYFGKSPILLSAAQNKLNQEGVLYQKPYVESSPAYKSTTNGIQSSPKLPDWLKDYFKALSDANLGVYPSPFCHQISALEAAFEGQDLFVSTGTGSGKTECFMWPLMAKLASEARNSPDSWAMRGVRTIIMYPMNALVSDQISRLRRLIGDVPFCEMFKRCRGTAASLQELAESIFPDNNLEDALQAVSVMLAIAPLARSESGSVLFPARMHMLFRGIKGVYACTNPKCSHSRTENGLTLGEVYFADGNLTCKECGSTVYELYNDRRCGSIFFRGFVLKQDFEARKRTYLWHQPGMMNEDEVKEIHLFIPSADYRLPERQGQNKILPCYLDVYSGFIDFLDDSLEGKPGIRKLYYSSFTAKARPDILTFATCPHCRHELSKIQIPIM